MTDIVKQAEEFVLNKLSEPDRRDPSKRVIYVTTSQIRKFLTAVNQLQNKMNNEKDTICDIAGKCCESGDIIIYNALVQKPEPNDILMVYATGAYNYSMASNYNRLPKPAVVMVDNGKSRVIVKRETYEDLIKNDI